LAREKSEAAARKASEHKVRKYISNMVSRDRVERGASLLLKHAGILGEVEREYGVPGEIIVAIWGIESSFGGFSGNTDCVEALANIAWRRGVKGDVTDAAYFRNELIEATRIVDKGLGVNTTETGENTKEPDGSNAFRVFKRRVALVGSWDGGLGQCQFMPSNYHVYAVDKDGDGAADIWNSLPDVFASMGNFISKYCEWDKSVRAAGFVATFENDASLKKLAAADAIGGFWAERRAWRPAKFFAWNGLRTTHREHAPVPSSESTLLMPDGAENLSSLAFLATANFRALMRYNPSTQYAMAVSTLAQEIVDEAAEITARRAREEKAREAEKVKAADATKKGKSSLPQTSQKKTDA
jgi:membrane-bound lytic murein transglycosylase B